MCANKSPIEQLTETDLIRKISEICSAVNLIVKEEELLEFSLKKTMELFQVNRGSIFIFDKDKNELVLKTVAGMARTEKETLVKQMGKGIVGRVAEIKEPVFVNDIEHDDRFANYKQRRSYHTQSFICAPLLVKDELLGVINITDKESGMSFTENDVQLLDFLTTQIALNFRRIQLYNKFRDVLKETKNLKDKLGQTDEERIYLKQQIEINEKLATIGKLAGGIAHEFNNPLDGVMRYTNLCLNQVQHDEVVREYLLEIKQGLNRMAKIVKNLLACSRNDTLSKDKISVKNAFNHSLKGQRYELEKRNITVESDFEKNLPPVPDLGLERVFSNLLRNAIDAVEKDGTIILKAGVMGDQMIIEMIDTGKGIPDGTMDKIFEPFYTTKEMEKGCGLGLTIVGEIIKSYNGTIKVGSKPNNGTTFTLSIPLEG